MNRILLQQVACFALAALTLAACGDDTDTNSTSQDAGLDRGSVERDLAVADTSVSDTSSADASSTDTSSTDTSPTDTTGGSDTGSATDTQVVQDDTSTGVDIDTDALTCEAVGLLGVCDDEVLHFCALGELRQRDCGTEFGAAGLTGTCAFISGSWGYDCALAADQPCIDSEGESAVCQGADSGCILSAGTEPTCLANVGSCNPDAAVQTLCQDDLLIRFCEVTEQPFGVDCSAFGGSCNNAGPANCEGITAGGPCNDTDLNCTEGLTCTLETCTTE